MKIAIISDTHGQLQEDVIQNIKACDEIWHAGDLGTIEIYDQLAEIKPIKAVYGNIDGHQIRQVAPLHQRFEAEGFDVWMTHIGGYPGRYDKMVREEIRQNPPDIFITGHSHILKVMPDDKLNLLHINPGATGHNGFHKFRTMVILELENKEIKDIKAIELGKRGRIVN
jgi:putative phosphoesterase